ncbi:hypothetical protein GW17_00040532 [Ensete ventricosum]|nr:hypothetical protein GW17_00040532 [Ensete ventricosum]
MDSKLCESKLNTVLIRQVIVNPKLKKKSNKTAFFFEGCLRAVVERYLEVEVSGLDRNGHPIKIDAIGWQARILQHECDHLDGTLYVDKMVPRTFRTVENLGLPLAMGCPPLGINHNLIVGGTSPGTHHPGGLVLQEQPNEVRKTRIKVTVRASTPVNLGLPAWSASHASDSNLVVRIHWTQWKTHNIWR